MRVFFYKTMICRSSHYHALKRSLWNVNKSEKALSDAQLLVGYSPVDNKLKSMLRGEVNIMKSVAQLIGSGHPITDLARNSFSQAISVGLWMLLITRATGQPLGHPEIDEATEHKQRSLAEIIELVTAAYEVHLAVVDTDHPAYTAQTNTTALDFGNKLAILGGDYLHAKASIELAHIYNTTVTEYISKGIADCAQGCAYKSPHCDTVTSLEEWERHVFLLRGSLLANACQSAALLARHDQKMIDNAYVIGESIARAQQCSDDVIAFKTRSTQVSQTNICAVIARESAVPEDNSCDREFILKQCPIILERAIKMSRDYVQTCLELAETLNDKKAIDSIKNILLNSFVK